MRTFLLTLALTAVAMGGANAETIQTRYARSLDLGSVKGVAYYTAETDGYHVVATLATDETSTPVRVMATLADGQTMTISTPGAASEAGSVIDIVRHGERLFVNPAAAAGN